MPKINRIVWATSFKRAFRKRVMGSPAEQAFEARLAAFVNDPLTPSLRTHKLSGSLEGLWAFSIAHDCRVLFKFIAEDDVLLIDVGTHEEVY